MVSFSSQGDFNNTLEFLKAMKNYNATVKGIMEKYGQQGVAALSAATPVDTGLTAGSWGYEIKRYNGVLSIYWTNTNINKNVNIALILQLGHGTRNGGYVQGRDYINPAIRPIFDRIAEEAWNEVVNA